MIYLDNPAYVAVALSTDDKMGDDSVMECVPEAGQIRAYTSWTLPRPNLGVTRQGVVCVFKYFGLITEAFLIFPDFSVFDYF